MSSGDTEVGILGAGGQSDEVEAYLGKRASFKAVDKSYLLPETKGVVIAVDEPSEHQILTPVVAAVGAPAVRKALVLRWPGDKYQSAISSKAVVDESTVIHPGCIIAHQAVITTNVNVGRHTIINVGATIGHDCSFGEYVTIGPGANIGGNVSLGDGVFVGIGATIKNDLNIAEGVVVGAGAVVIKDIVEPNSVYVGVPARIVSRNEGWLSEV